MFEKNKKTNTTETTDQENQEVATAKPTGNKVAKITNEESGIDEMFKFAKKAKGIEITAEYLDLSELEEGKNFIFVFTGMTTFNTPEKGEQPAANLIAEDKQQYIIASKVVVSALQRIADEVPVAVGITVNGKKKSANGSYYDCTVIRY